MPCPCGKGYSNSKNAPTPRHHQTLLPIKTNTRKYTSRADMQNRNPIVLNKTKIEMRSVENKINSVHSMARAPQFSTLGGFLPKYTRRNISILTH